MCALKKFHEQVQQWLGFDFSDGHKKIGKLLDHQRLDFGQKPNVLKILPQFYVKLDQRNCVEAIIVFGNVQNCYKHGQKAFTNLWARNFVRLGGEP